mgnify:CR=1 FL=1
MTWNYALFCCPTRAATPHSANRPCRPKSGKIPMSQGTAMSSNVTPRILY